MTPDSYPTKRDAPASLILPSQTIDVGFVHTLTVPGGPCRPDCPHPQHNVGDAEERHD